MIYTAVQSLGAGKGGKRRVIPSPWPSFLKLLFPSSENLVGITLSTSSADALPRAANPGRQGNRKGHRNTERNLREDKGSLTCYIHRCYYSWVCPKSTLTEHTHFLLSLLYFILSYSAPAPDTVTGGVRCKGPWLYACHITVTDGNNVTNINSTASSEL